ncbi:MAG: hypothetical protein IKH16_13325 [Selenomonadaceae bacterium]|nr:hypothetical protein [Selenomonadaceae bacterium]
MANGWGGVREGAGRPLTAGVARKQRQTRATDEEWTLIKRFDRLVKYGDKAACIKALEKLEATTE